MKAVIYPCLWLSKDIIGKPGASVALEMKQTCKKLIEDESWYLSNAFYLTMPKEWS